jgi:hypothetical protein
MLFFSNQVSLSLHMYYYFYLIFLYILTSTPNPCSQHAKACQLSPLLAQHFL